MNQGCWSWIFSTRVQRVSSTMAFVACLLSLVSHINDWMTIRKTSNVRIIRDDEIPQTKKRAKQSKNCEWINTYSWEFLDFFIWSAQRCQTDFLRELSKVCISQQWHMTQELMDAIAVIKRKEAFNINFFFFVFKYPRDCCRQSDDKRRIATQTIQRTTKISWWKIDSTFHGK